MIKVHNNIGRGLCINLNKDNTLRLQPYGAKEIDDNLVSRELKSNEKAGYVTLAEVKKAKATEPKKKGE